MNSREKFHSVMDDDNRKVNLKAEFAYWAATIKNWFLKGLRQKYEISDDITDSESLRGSKPLSGAYMGSVDLNVMDYFKLDSYLEKFPFDIKERRGSSLPEVKNLIPFEEPPFLGRTAFCHSGHHKTLFRFFEQDTQPGCGSSFQFLGDQNKVGDALLNLVILK